MRDLLTETYRTLDWVRKSGVTPKSIRAVMGSREAVWRLARRIPGAVRRTGLPLDVLAADLGVGEGEDLYRQILECPRRSDLIERYTEEYNAFFGAPEEKGPDSSAAFLEENWASAQAGACPF